MTFKIVVTELQNAHTDTAEVKRYEQTVDELDLPKLIAAINTKKRGPRVKAEKK